MAILETNSELGRQVVADAKQYVLHSWSVQDALDPIAVAGGEGRYFWDYDGKPDRTDPRQIELQDKREIAIVIGSPPAEIPSSFGSG